MENRPPFWPSGLYRTIIATSLPYLVVAEVERGQVLQYGRWPAGVRRWARPRRSRCWSRQLKWGGVGSTCA
jgi:hypothetical protein